MWKLSTTIKDVAVEPQTMVRVSAHPKGRKSRAPVGSDTKHAPGTRLHGHPPQKHEALHKSPPPIRQAAKPGTVHRWHIPSRTIRHKIKPAPHSALAPNGMEARAAGRQPHRPNLPERITAHPGEVLREEFLKPLGLSVNRLAGELCVPANRIGAIIKGERSVSADTALRLGRYFRTSPEFWMNLQAMHDLTRTRLEFGSVIEREIRPRR